MKLSRLLLLIFCLCPLAAYAQTAEISGAVQDPSGAVIPKASVEFRNQDTGVRRQTTTNGSGIYHLVGIDPGSYDATVQASGFKTLTRDNVTLKVAEKAQIDFKMQVGNAGETVTVDGSGLQINTADGSVSTVIDRQFVANIPLNGRSFQDLISMTPGVVTASPQSGAIVGSGGDFSINGQRTESNYYMVDGVAANIGAGPGKFTGLGAAGVTAGTSALGTTQSLLSVDALQEFRVESSSYSAEYGRTPGGQLTFVTRSGTNALHGSAYDYFRNGWFDANDWFNDRVGARKAQLHQNDFGGTLGGPVWIPRLYKGTDKTFFFGSYEGLRMTAPVAATIQYVPDLYMRQQAPAAIQPLLNAFPLPTANGIDYGTAQSPSLAQFFQGYSLPGTINSTSIRLDQTFTPKLSAFVRFADTPSSIQSRTLSVLGTNHLNTQTYTLGTTYVLSHSTTNQFRLGYSRSYSATTTTVDSFGGATPVDLGKALGNTSKQTGQNLQAEVYVSVPGAGSGALLTSASATKQNQWNVVDTIDLTHGTHQLKFGLDYRRIRGDATPPTYIYGVFQSSQAVLSDSATAVYQASLSTAPIYNQTAVFAQDTWRVSDRFSLSGGLRWEVLPPPHNGINPQPYTVAGSLANPATLTLAPAGTPLWHTSYFSFAPRLGAAWQAHRTKNWETVLRGGGGVFFDTPNESAYNAFGTFGTSTSATYLNASLPLTQAQQNISVTIAPRYTNLYVYPTHLQNAYTLQWNASVEQGLGTNNVATISYVGSAGRRLGAIRRFNLTALTPTFGTINYAINNSTSDYDALQVKFQRSVAKGLSALASYTWAHSIDYGSNALALPLTRGNSDFDVRNNFQAGVTYNLPHFAHTKFASAVVNGWGVDGRFLSRTSFPVTLQGNLVTDPVSGTTYYNNVNLVAGQPIYLNGPQYPGGRSLNRAAFVSPTNSTPGSAPRNFARGFGESQFNFSTRRDFAFSERIHLQFRAEAFNIFNHPNFGYIDPTLTDATFGQATLMLNQSLGTVSSQYQQGGPRSMQFSLRLAF